VPHAPVGVERIVDRENGTAGVAEDHVDVALDEDIDQRLGAIALAHGRIGGLEGGGEYAVVHGLHDTDADGEKASDFLVLPDRIRIIFL
jgi:hypothetical protein